MRRINIKFPPYFVWFKDSYINIPENGNDGLAINWVGVEPGNYRAEVQVADYFGNQIVRYDTETGRIIEVLLDEADGLDRPVAMEMGPMGGLYVLDRRALLRVSEGSVEALFTHEQEGLIWPRNLHLVSLSSSERLSHPSGEIEEQLHHRF